ncbi:MAG: AEC family transporter [Candidatus Eisenbacteria sp.]|nr:AEC family transporter [Candidatus Eisenbacteria bacterium]
MNLLTIIMPVFLVIGLGYALRRFRFIEEEANAWLSRLVFYVAAPALLFRSTAQSSFDWGTSAPTLALIGGLTTAAGIVLYLAARGVAPARRGVLVQGALRSNTVFVGLPVVLNAYGESALALASLLIAFMVVFENFLAVIVLTVPHRERSALDPRLWMHTAMRVLRNPLIIGCAGGLLYGITGLELPATLDRSLALVGSIAAPLGLLCVGAELDLRKLQAEIPGTALAAVIKLIAYPALVYGGLRLLGLEGLALEVPVLIMACPTAVVSYIMAREMAGDERFGAAIVIGTTTAALITLVLWLAVLTLG